MEFTRLLGQIGTYLEQGVAGAPATSNGWPRPDERRLVPPLESTDPAH